jgi:hypothetical protein
MSGVALGTMNSIPEGSEGAPTPVPGQFPSSAQMNNHNHMNNFKYPTARASSSNNSNGSCSGSGAQQTVVGQNEMFLMPPSRLNLQTDPKKVVYGMALSNSGLEIRVS